MHITYEVWQDGMPVASTEGPDEQALRGARHYALMYGQDGPVKIYKVTREEVE